MVQRLQPIADTAWMFSLFVLTAIFASASTYTPFLYFRF